MAELNGGRRLHDLSGPEAVLYRDDGGRSSRTCVIGGSWEVIREQSSDLSAFFGWDV